MCSGLNRLLKRSAKCGLLIAVQAEFTSPVFDELTSSCKAWGLALDISRSRAVDSRTAAQTLKIIAQDYWMAP